MIEASDILWIAKMRSFCLVLKYLDDFLMKQLPCELFNKWKEFMVISTIVIEFNLANKLNLDALVL